MGSLYHSEELVIRSSIHPDYINYLWFHTKTCDPLSLYGHPDLIRTKIGHLNTRWKGIISFKFNLCVFHRCPQNRVNRLWYINSRFANVTKWEYRQEKVREAVGYVTSNNHTSFGNGQFSVVWLNPQHSVLKRSDAFIFQSAEICMLATNTWFIPM